MAFTVTLVDCLPNAHCVTNQLAGWLTGWVIQYLYGSYVFFCTNSHCIHFIYNLKKASFQRFPLLPKQMSDISGFPPPAHEASRRIALLVFLTNVRYIKNSTPQSGVTQVRVELIVNINRVLHKSHAASTGLTRLRDDTCWQRTTGVCECVCQGPCFLAMLAGMCGSVCVCETGWLSVRGNVS